MATEYHIYSNTGAGDPINYASPLATVSALTWTSSALSYPGIWSFNVRAFDTVSGLEEQNLDCNVTMILGPSGQDISNQPLPPAGVRGFALAGGSIKVEWSYPVVNGARSPAGFHVYMGTASPNYSAPAATTLFTTGLANSFSATLSGLTDGTTYTIGVRAFNAISEEQNTLTVAVVADSTGPSAVVSLTGSATSTQG